MDSYSSYQSGSNVAVRGDRFKTLSHTIGSNIAKIWQNVASMSKMVNQLQTPQDSQELRTQLRNIQHYTQQLAKDTSTLLKEFMNIPLAADDTASKLAKSRLSDEYLSTLNQFQLVQKQAAEKTKEEVRKCKEQNFNINTAFSEGRYGVGSQDATIDFDVPARQQEQVTIQNERELLELEERERDMRQIETDIVAVNDIFKELGQLITEQGTVVDSIEASIEHTADNVHAGTVQLREASNYQNKARKKKVYLLLAAAVVIIILLIILFNH